MSRSDHGSPGPLVLKTPGIRRLLPVLLLLLLLPASRVVVPEASALTLVSKTKQVTLAPDGSVRALYGHAFLVSGPGDRTALAAFIDAAGQAAMEPGSLRLRLDTPGQSRGHWSGKEGTVLETLGSPTVLPGTRVELEFSTLARFDGFQGLFPDFFTLHQETPAALTYTLSFPGPTAFQARVEEEGRRSEITRTDREFAWTSPGARSLDLMITTADRAAITLRYGELYRRAYGKGLGKGDLPPDLADLGSMPPRERLTVLLDYLGNRYHLEPAPGPGHDLVPRSPAETLARGRGDCKDLALLGCALLERAGVGAGIALTGRSRLRGWAGELPDPFAYSHALISVDRDGYGTLLDVASGREFPPCAGDLPPVFVDLPGTLPGQAPEPSR
jgi:hypothetical protein